MIVCVSGWAWWVLALILHRRQGFLFRGPSAVDSTSWQRHRLDSLHFKQVAVTGDHVATLQPLQSELCRVGCLPCRVGLVFSRQCFSVVLAALELSP